MSSAGVANPIPKNTKTVNDMFATQDSSPQKQPKPLEVKRLSTHGSIKNNNLNNSQMENSYNDNYASSGYDTSKSRTKSLAKKRTSNSLRRNVPRSGAKIKIRNNSVHVNNDFDDTTVNEGLDEIDLILDQLENNIPEEIYEYDDYEVEEMMKSNRLLREKIGDISQMVATAIQKASKLKKQIITHRDAPADPTVKSKRKEIKKYQLKVTTWKDYIKTLKNKLSTIGDADRISTESNKLKIIDAEIKELENQKKVLSKNNKVQQDTMNKLYDDPEFRDKVANCKADIQKVKERYTQLEKRRNLHKKDRDSVTAEMTSLNSAKLKLRESKIKIEKGNKKFGQMGKAMELKEENDAINNRNKIWSNILNKNTSKLKSKIHDKEKRIQELQQEIMQAKKDLKAKISENEKFSQEAKHFKGMVPEKANKDISIIEDPQDDYSKEHRDNPLDVGMQGTFEHDNDTSDKEDEESRVRTPVESVGL